MKRVRVSCETRNPEEDRHLLSRIRRDLYTHNLIDIDPDSPALVIHAGVPQGAYFDLSVEQEQIGRIGEFLEQRHRVGRYAHAATIAIVEGIAGDPCLNCGHIAGSKVPAVCPRCGFRDTSDCPNCGREISRQAYVHIAGDLEQCPECRAYVRLEFNEPLLKPNGEYNEPVVMVVEAA